MRSCFCDNSTAHSSARPDCISNLKVPRFTTRNSDCTWVKSYRSCFKKLEVPSDPESCLIQCFEADELIRLRESGCPYRLIQLLGDRFEVNLESIAKYAYGIGPSLNMLAKREVDSAIESTGLVENAKQLGLKVHPYTVRRQMQPKWSTSLDETHRVLLETLRVDGFFTDYPDLGRSAVDKLSK